MGNRLSGRSTGGGGTGNVGAAGGGAAALLATAAFLVAWGAAAWGQAVAPEEVAVGRFSAGDLAGWKVREFKGRTRYEIEDDPEGGGGPVLAASSRGAASALYHEREIDLAATPILSWRWRVESPLPIADERRKGGDDFVARVYVVSEGHGLLGLPFGITYVWANAPVGEAWAQPVHRPGRSWSWSTPARGATGGATSATFAGGLPPLPRKGRGDPLTGSRS